jgi:signal transduction histidine kinase
VPAWREDAAGGRVLDVTLPAPWPGPPEGFLRVGLAAEPVEAAVLGEARRNLVILTGLALLLGTGGFLLLAYRERRTFRRESELRAALLERERFASLGRFAGGVAHEVRSPLNALSMAAQRLRRELAGTTQPDTTPPDPARTAELLGAISDAVARLDRTVEEFLALGRLRTVVATEDPDARLIGPEQPVTAIGDADLTAKAVGNLVRNAREAAPGTVELSCVAHGGRVEVRVRDRGPGVPEEDRARVFEPFFSRREGGTGLGLSIAREAVERQGGSIALESPPGGGTAFAIVLPSSAGTEHDGRGESGGSA